jgi:hypothetical protein
MAKGLRTGGRLKGTPNHASALRQKLVAQSGETPLEHLLRIMRRKVPEDASPELRFQMESLSFEAAKAAAPYVHPKLATVEHTGKDGGAIKVEEISDLEAARRIAFLFAKGALQLDTDDTIH